ncbi:hypothetical protein [Aestuariivirga sp.]|jgi:hypothetical protein|uniref:hypothetical protein n=1 Tax=Aestuariivirga sp. TaxID=2650926 RepID=UPI003783575A
MARGMILWLVIMLVETTHGVLRGLFLAPHLGESNAARVGWPIGLLLVLLVSIVGIRWTRVSGRPALLRLGGLWAAATALFEVLVGVLRGLDGPALLAAIDPRTGSVFYSAIVMFLAPVLAWRLSRPAP